MAGLVFWPSEARRCWAAWARPRSVASSMTSWVGPFLAVPSEETGLAWADTRPDGVDGGASWADAVSRQKVYPHRKARVKGRRLTLGGRCRIRHMEVTAVWASSLPIEA